jgi:CBS-domain-containing membrane protein
MKAREVMTRTVVAVRADTTVQEIARVLLEREISAVPVLDGLGAPIGIVSEGDLIRGDAAEAKRERWLAMLAEGEPLSADFLSSFGERTAADIMSKPVVTVSDDAEVSEIARTLQGLRIKRAPVLHNGKMVGIVSRTDLLRALTARPAPWPSRFAKARRLAHATPSLEVDDASAHASSEDAPPDDGVPSVDDFRRLVTDHEERERKDGEELRKSVVEKRRRVASEFAARHISDEVWHDLIHKSQLAAQTGQKEFMLLRFPSELCSDGGRAVNAPAPDWPATLRGEAAEIYQRWEQDLAPRGFHISARVVDFPGGMPGDIGIFLVWR